MKGSIEKRGEKCYRLRVDLGLDTSGRRVQKSITVRGTRKDAEKRLAEIVNDMHRGTALPVRTMTVSQYLDHWLGTYVAKLAPRTYYNYRDYVELYIRPSLGRRLLQDLSPLHIQSFYTDLEQNARKRDGKPLSPTTIFHTHRVLKGALKRAVQWQLLMRNPAEAATAPRMAERPPRTLNIEQVAGLLGSARNTRLYLPILLALCTGMRRGEMAGLRWQDVNLERSLITIRQTLVCVTPGRVEFKAPKTRSGRRAVPIPSILVEELREELLRLGALRDALGPAYNPENVVICREDGRPVHPTTLYTAFQKLVVRLGLPRIALHDLRHSHATHLLELGVHPKVVSERLGHSDPALTLRVYSHVMANIQEEAAQQTDELLRGAINREEKRNNNPGDPC